MQHPELSHLKLSRAWEGGSILRRPANRGLIARGFYPTYEKGRNPKHAKVSGPQHPSVQKGVDARVQSLKDAMKKSKYAAKPVESYDKNQDNVVVLEALQRLLRNQKQTDRPFAEFGQARPMR